MNRETYAAMINYVRAKLVARTIMHGGAEQAPRGLLSLTSGTDTHPPTHPLSRQQRRAMQRRALKGQK